MVRLVKRYGSRKLYDTEESRYVALEEIGDWIRAGQEIRVVDNDSGEDVTAPTLSQVILEDSRRGGAAAPPVDSLHELIRRGGVLVTSSVGQIQDAADRLLKASLDKLSPVREVKEETAVLRRRLEQLEEALARMETSEEQHAADSPVAIAKKTVKKPARG